MTATMLNVKSATRPIDKHAHCTPPQVQHTWIRTHGANNSIPEYYLSALHRLLSLDVGIFGRKVAEDSVRDS